MPDELDPATYGLTIWDLDREFLTGGVGGVDKMTLGDLLGVLRDAYCRTIGVEYMHIQDTDEQRWIQAKVEGTHEQLDQGAEATASSSGSTPPRRSRSSSPPSTSAPSASASRAPSRRSRSSTRSSPPPPTPGFDGASLGMAHRGRLNVLSNIMGKSYDAIFSRVRGPRRPDLGAGLGRRQVPPRRDGQVRQPVAAPTSRVELAANPSHLETVDPIVLGMVRAQQDQIEPPGSFPCCRC